MKIPFRVVLLVASALCESGSLYAQTTYDPYRFSTFAGSPGPGGTTDGTGSAARFTSPSGVAVDASRNVYVADTFNNTIRKITPAGFVRTFAGSAGLSGSANGTGSAARFDAPIGVAVDNGLNVYVADSTNNTIRKITSAGDVTTLAGSAGLVGSANGTGSAARFFGPRGVAVDSARNIYVADTFNHTIRKITPAGVVSTFAGSAGVSGSLDGTGNGARFFHPEGVAVDTSFNVYVADTFNNTIRKITPAKVVTTLAGTAGMTGSSDGTGPIALFSTPIGIAVNRSGTLLVADADNQLIRKVTAAGIVTTLGGAPGAAGSADGLGSNARFNSPQGVAVNSAGKVYVGDTGNNTVRSGLPQTAAKTDFNGDGFSDYLLFNPNTLRTAIWNLQGSAFLSGVYGPTLPAGWMVASVADINLDGRPDYVLFNSNTRRTAIWLLDNNAFIGGVYGPILPPGWAVIGAADIDRDGKPDYVLFNASTRRTAVWYLNGAVYVSGAFGPTLPSGWTLSDALDFNSDGKPDFVLHNASTRKTAIWYLDGSIFVGGVYGPDLPSGWTLRGAADFDADGKPDYVLYNSSTRRSALWYLNGAAFVRGAYGPTLAAGYDLASP